MFFDLGGVVVTDLFPLMDSYLSGISGVQFQKVKVIRNQYWPDYELGRMTGIEFFRRQLADLGSGLGPEEVMAKSLEVVKVKEDVLSIVKRLRASGNYGMGVISNNSDEWAEHLEKTLGLGQYFDAWIISSHHHIKKPDKEIYLLAAEKLGLNAGDCIFIDNKLRNVQGAEAAGMTAIHFKDAEQLEAELKRLGLDF
ncbi:HAD family phosphatase [Candidatus Woesearchaeota archaeon]|nr:HAD family phosphatase [Candidatus Woesearchaeota archaeon]